MNQIAPRFCGVYTVAITGHPRTRTEDTANSLLYVATRKALVNHFKAQGIHAEVQPNYRSKGSPKECLLLDDGKGTYPMAASVYRNLHIGLPDLPLGPMSGFGTADLLRAADALLARTNTDLAAPPLKAVQGEMKKILAAVDGTAQVTLKRIPKDLTAKDAKVQIARLEIQA